MPSPLFRGTCSTCRLAGLKAPQVCGLSGKTITADGYCDEHRRSISKCSICGNIVLSNGVIDDTHLICWNCFSSLKTCVACKNANICRFETDPSSLPKVVQKQVRRGNMTAVTQVKNPERVRATCEKGCKCFSKEKGCLKENNTACKNQEIKYNDV